MFRDSEYESMKDWRKESIEECGEKIFNRFESNLYDVYLLQQSVISLFIFLFIFATLFLILIFNIPAPHVSESYYDFLCFSIFMLSLLSFGGLIYRIKQMKKIKKELANYINDQ